MTDIQLIHGSDDFYPTQRVHTWGMLERSDRRIFFLSTGKNSCTDIAYLLKMKRETVRNRLCLLRLLGYVSLQTKTGKRIAIQPIVESMRTLYPYHRLCVQKFYDTLCQELPELNQYFSRHHITLEQLESEFVTFLRFMIRAMQYTDQKVEIMLDAIIRGYRLCSVTEEQFEIVIRCFLEAVHYCIQEMWTDQLGESWNCLCHVIEYAIFAKCQQV